MPNLFGFYQPLQAQRTTVSMNNPRPYQRLAKLDTSRSGFTVNNPKTHLKSPLLVLSCLIAIISNGIFFTLAKPRHTLADNLNSSSYFIQFSTINIGGGQISSPNYELGTTIGQTAQGQFDSAGFIVKAGFQYIHPLVPFTFTISNLDINFGTVSPQIPATATNTLTVTTGSAYGYAVKVVESNSLRISNGSATIPDTSCDLALTCTIADATPWTSNTRYGFGYNMQGTDVDTSDFVNSTYFRPFPIQNIDSPATVMSRPNVATGSSATATYKINISGSQAAGTYQNSLQYIAIPSF